ncbi:hypothetical protein SZN_02332 [Streptomyces zinciresistens K42]|uniref:Uncharacterized protein n=1 Tax=Streptomyces zinciresistens K42 TaxID=700597 RepID=G2G4R3_9ACTN|nr:hypothetical protein [Streptomyces zinciresistens]EGX61536.1 hypothetical protein SZN_02332 [Streptomyces zinciresistens K42]
MSEHVIEDLVADSVGVLDAYAGVGDPRVRDWLAVLYGFESAFDCSFTRFRVLDVLLRRRFTYRFPVHRHPDHAGRFAYFDGLTQFTALRTFDEDASGFGGDESWLEDGYVEPPFLYCDAGTALWRRMVAAGELSGADAVPLRRTPLIEVVREVVVAAEKEQDRELIGLWYGFGCGTLLGGPAGCPWDVEEVAEMPAVRDVRAVVRRTDALSFAAQSAYACPVESADDQDLEAWWWQL